MACIYFYINIFQSAQTNPSPMTSGGGMAGDVMCGGGPPGNPYFQVGCYAVLTLF